MQIPPGNRRLGFCLSRDVLCRIESRREKGRLVVRIAGRLTEAHVSDLLEACSEAVADPPLLELDELVSADAVGTDVLLRLERRGAQLVGLPEYLRLELEAHARQRKR
jgi:hypothetical protein